MRTNDCIFRSKWGARVGVKLIELKKMKKKKRSLKKQLLTTVAKPNISRLTLVIHTKKWVKGNLT